MGAGVMTGKAPLPPTLSLVPQLWLPGSRRVVQECVSLGVSQIPREAGNRHTGDAPSSGLGSFSLPRPHLSSLTPPTPSALPPTGTCARAPDAVPAFLLVANHSFLQFPGYRNNGPEALATPPGAAASRLSRPSSNP